MSLDVETEKQTHEKRKAEKYDKDLELTIRRWIATRLPHRKEECEDLNLSAHLLLKNGVLLCELVNSLSHGAIKKIETNATIAFKQMVLLPSQACRGLGMSTPELFETLNLFEDKDMMSVLQHLSLLQRLSENLNATPKELQPSPKEHQKSLTSSSAESKTPKKTPPQPRKEAPIPALGVSSLEADVRVKEELKYNRHLEAQAWDWIEAMIKETVGERTEGKKLTTFLKSGVVLCKLANAIVPGSIPRIHTKSLAFAQMENIGNFLNVMASVGLDPPFTTVDLFEEKNPSDVIKGIHVIAHGLAKEEGFQGPVIVEDKSKTYSLIAASEVGDIPQLAETRPLADQEKQLLNWVNVQFFKNGISEAIQNFDHDLRNGVRLIKLLHVFNVISTDIAFHLNPQSLWEYMQNTTLLIRGVTSAVSVSVQCTATDIVNGNIDAVCGLVSLIRSSFDLEYMFSSMLTVSDQVEEVELDEEEIQAFASNSDLLAQRFSSSANNLQVQALKEYVDQYLALQVAETKPPVERTIGIKKSPSENKTLSLKRKPSLDSPRAKITEPRPAIRQASEESIQKKEVKKPENVPTLLLGKLPQPVQQSTPEDIGQFELNEDVNLAVLDSDIEAMEHLPVQTPRSMARDEKKKALLESRQAKKSARGDDSRFAPKRSARALPSPRAGSPREKPPTAGKQKLRESGVSVQRCESGKTKIILRRKTVDTVITTFKFTSGPQYESVFLDGEFTKGNTVPMKKQNGIFEVQFPLPIGTYQYRFKVSDNEFKIDPKYPHTVDTVNQVAWNVMTVAPQVAVSAAQEKMRSHLVFSLFKTEELYSKGLGIIINGLINPTQALNQLTQQEMDSVFGNLFQLHKLHTSFKFDIKDTLATWETTPQPTIGQIFLKHMPLFREYEAYMNTWVSASLALSRTRQIYPEFEKLVQKFEESQEDSLMNVPFFLGLSAQRSVQYLQDIKKYTDKAHPDSPLLKECLNALQELSSENKSTLNLQELVSIQKLTTVANSIDGGEHLMLFKRKFEYEGSMKLESVTKASSSRKKMLLHNKGHYWFLFNDVLVFCSKKKVLGEGKLFNHIETSYIADFKNVVPVEETKLQINFNSKEIWLLTAYSTKDRNQWVYIIDLLIKEKLFKVHRATVLNIVDFVAKTQQKAHQIKMAAADSNPPTPTDEKKEQTQSPNPSTN